MSNEIELYSKLNNPLEAIDAMGEFFAKSGMFGCERVEQGKVLALACLAEKKSPFEIKRTYHLMNGELSMRYDAMLAGFRAKGGRHKVIARTEEKACIELTMDGQTVLFSFTWGEAQKEPFVYAKDGKSLKKNWATPRARMQLLWARCVSDGVRALCPEVVSGTYTPEELEESPASAPAIVLAAPEPPAQPQNETKVKPEPPKPKPAPEPPPPSSVVYATSEQVAKMEEVFGDNQGKVLTWLVREGWLTDTQTIKSLPGPLAQRIINQAPSFMKKVLAS